MDLFLIKKYNELKSQDSFHSTSVTNLKNTFVYCFIRRGLMSLLLLFCVIYIHDMPSNSSLISFLFSILFSCFSYFEYHLLQRKTINNDEAVLFVLVFALVGVVVCLLLQFFLIIFYFSIFEMTLFCSMVTLSILFLCFSIYRFFVGYNAFSLAKKLDCNKKIHKLKNEIIEIEKELRAYFDNVDKAIYLQLKSEQINCHQTKIFANILMKEQLSLVGAKNEADYKIKKMEASFKREQLNKKNENNLIND